MLEDNNKTYLGIDWGTARIGLAMGDSETRMATPFKTVPDLKSLLAVIEKEVVDELVIGRPLKKNDPDRPVFPPYEEFLAQLKKQAGLPIHEIDERLTSRAADQLGAGSKGQASRDEVAAMLILQSYFDTESI